MLYNAVVEQCSSAVNGSEKPDEQPVVISLRDVTVAYRSYKERPTSVKESLIRLLRDGKIKHYSTFDALSNFNIEVPKGEVLGIIGGNGSGKSTLLKVLAQVLKPTNGSVKVDGTVASLIELGAGFDPELNAIENLYLNGSLYRRSRSQIKDRIPHILEFAELQEFATTPVKYYSSGMYARLGFSAAIDIDPEILLVDEILGVGDERFNQKCQKVFENFLNRSRTLVIVSHNLDMLKNTANRIALLSRGRLAFLGDPATAVEMYRDETYLSALS